jgi:hypothetical protein
MLTGIPLLRTYQSQQSLCGYARGVRDMGKWVPGKDPPSPTHTTTTQGIRQHHSCSIGMCVLYPVQCTVFDTGIGVLHGSIQGHWP